MGYRNYATANGFIVDKLGNGDFTTIAAAITAAVSGDTIFIRPGTYTENPTLKAGITLAAYPSFGTFGASFPGNVIISGKCTLTAAGNVTIYGLTLQTNSDFAVSVTGSAASVIVLDQCYLNCTNNTGIQLSSSSSSSSIVLTHCNGDVGTTGIAKFANSGAGSIRFLYTTFTNSGLSTTASTCSSTGGFFPNFSAWSNGISLSSSSSMAGDFLDMTMAAVQTCITTSGTASFNIQCSTIATEGASSAINLGSGTSGACHWCLINSSNANPIAGTGTFLCTAIGYNSVSGIQSTVIQQPEFITLGAQAVAIPAGDYTVKGYDYFIGASSSSAHTITLPASPITGILYRIKDVTGSALINNITVSGNGNNIDGAATYAINQNYGSIDVLFNGTTWSVV